MTNDPIMAEPRCRAGWNGAGLLRGWTQASRRWSLAFLAALAAFSTRAADDTNTPVRPPETPREFYNAGTEKLIERKLREAETLLQTAVGSQEARVQRPALYNLGIVRWAQGADELKKSPAAPPTAARGREAAARAADAVNDADAALANPEVQRLLQSYLRGRGARRELRDAGRAIARALDLHGVALTRWLRSSGDFKSAVELNPADTNAQFNADLMDRKIAQLVDQIQQLQRAAMMMGEQNRKLIERLRQLRGMIPEALMPPGAAGDEEEDEDLPFGPRPGQVEVGTREGNERSLTPEEAAQLLDSFKLDSNRRMPMGQGDQADPKDRKRSNW